MVMLSRRTQRKLRELDEMSNNPLRRDWVQAAIAIAVLALAVGGFMWAYLS